MATLLRVGSTLLLVWTGFKLQQQQQVWAEPGLDTVCGLLNGYNTNDLECLEGHFCFLKPF